MATSVSKLDLTNHSGLTAVSNWITQINVGDTIYDIATHHGIKFRDGSSDTTGTIWNGLTDIEVIIPSLEDLVKDPIKFAGTVGSDGKAKDGNNNEISPAKGDLVYITANCTFGGEVCEAGDMAVYDGSAWRVVSGENQVSISGVDAETGVADIVLTSTAKEVLTVEGKKLKLSVNWSDGNSALDVKMNEDDEWTVDANVTVASKTIALTQASDSEVVIGSKKNIDLPSALANGDVTISQKVLVSSNFTFDSGSLPAASLNTAAIDLNVSNTMSISKGVDGDTGDFVATIDGAIKSVSLVEANVSTADITYVAAVSLIDGSKSYISRIRTAESTEAADLTIHGQATVSNSTFVSGLGTEAATGDVVSSITVGAVTFDSAKSDFVTGLSTAVSGGDKAVITNVSFGSVASNASSWFVSGLGTEAATGDVVSSISVGTVDLVADNNSSFAGSAIVSASVNGNVLSFNTSSFMQPVKVSQATTTVSYKPFTKAGVELTGYGVSSADFVKGGFAQASTTVSYKSVLTGDVTLSYGDDQKYMLDKAAVPEINKTISYAKLDHTDATIKKNSYSLVGGVTAAISASKVLTGFNAGSLPSLSIADASGELTGTVGTSLTTSSVSWYAVATAASKITLPGAYSLTTDSSADGAIDVAVAGTYTVNGTVTIASNSYVTGVSLS